MSKNLIDRIRSIIDCSSPLFGSEFTYTHTVSDKMFFDTEKTNGCWFFFADQQNPVLPQGTVISRSKK